MVTQTVSGETATAGVWLKFMLRRNNMDTFTNPVLSGFYADPSIPVSAGLFLCLN